MGIYLILGERRTVSYRKYQPNLDLKNEEMAGDRKKWNIFSSQNPPRS